MSPVAQHLEKLRARIALAARACGRDPAGIRLVAVSKTKPLADVLEAARAGQTDFGENYAQEFTVKALNPATADLRWHFIGALQSNKAKLVVGRACLIHTLDRASLAQTVQKLCEKSDIVQDCLLEIRLAKEAAKHGCPPETAPALLREITHLDRVRVRGLMTVGTATPDESVTRGEFRALRELRDRLNGMKIYPYPLSELSMGMSGDFEIAVAEGATILRVGSLIFGERPPK